MILSTSLSSRTANTFASPVVEARRWLQEIDHETDLTLINVSQAAPTEPPVKDLQDAIVFAAQSNPAAHLYGPVLGLPELRSEVAKQWGSLYDGEINSEQVAITAGCNQAFCAAINLLTNQGDSVILPEPWYFNHVMWLNMQGIEVIELQCGQNLLPDPDKCADLLRDNTRAITLVTPNNPTGVEYPIELIQAFYELAKSHEIALIVDETYRDFRAEVNPPHRLFGDPDWPNTLLHLYSFSKAYRLTGHRVGALIGAEERLKEAEKFLDTVTICPNQLAQHAALWGLRNLGGWLQGERDKLRHRQAQLEEKFAHPLMADWEIKGIGPYFAYVEHPFDLTSIDLAQSLLAKKNILVLPGSMFRPERNHFGERELRIACANLNQALIQELTNRLIDYTHDQY
ncbi:MAG: aminotransferase [Aestuariivita sp.]|nr:aminotransferase [Aestuariivita sp.]MCY4347792.1 aminotransferase [Aestuariivita sp.]